MSIPNQAVEAAKKVAFERYGSKPDTAYLRTILEAAAPHMLADAWDEAFAWGSEYGVRAEGTATIEGKELTPPANPYRSQA